MLVTKITPEKIESVEDGIEELILLQCRHTQKGNINLKVMWKKRKCFIVQLCLPQTKPQPIRGEN